LLHHGPVEWPVSRGWQEQIQCHGKVGLSSKHEDDQDDVSRPLQVLKVVSLSFSLELADGCG